MNCDCDICKIAVQSVVTNPSKFGKSSEPRGRLKKEIPKLPAAKPITVCERCYQVIGKGIKHPKNCSITDRRVI